MADLYDRLDDIQGMVRVLGADVKRLRALLEPQDEGAAPTEVREGNRRFYVRAVFSQIEAVVEQHKRLLLDLAGRNVITLDSGLRHALSERAYLVGDNGKVSERELFLNLQKKIRALYSNAVVQAFGSGLDVPFDDDGWNAFRRAVDVRDRITHPKTFLDCHVDDEAIVSVDRADEWFRSLNRAFVVAARQHREEHGW